jgi:tensin
VGTSHIRKNTAAAAANDGSADPPKSGDSNVNVDVNVNVNADVDSVPVTTNRSKEELLGSFRLGWGSMVEATKQALEATRDAVEHQKHSLLKEVVHRRAMDYARTVDMPLDVAALKDADVVYVTDRIITMGHPAMQGTTNTALTPERKLAAISHLLQKRHEGRFMVWNLSEVEYDYSMLDDQVLAYKFPGSPSPPLGLLLKLLLSLESWLKADSRNVAVLHCLTGRGRTSTVLAAFLCWTGEAEFSDPHAALAYIARCKRMPHANALTIPSQRRYATYFSNMLDGVRPSQPPLLLKRILLSQSPRVSIFQ